MMIKLDLKMHKMLGARLQWMNEHIFDFMFYIEHSDITLHFIMYIVQRFFNLCNVVVRKKDSIRVFHHLFLESAVARWLFRRGHLLLQNCGDFPKMKCKCWWKMCIFTFFTFTWVSLYLFLLVHLLDEILLCLGTIWSLDGDFLCKFHTSAFVESHFS